jgi:ATP-dependent protease ClpP protease subunit
MTLIGVHDLINTINEMLYRDINVTLFISSGGGCVTSTLLLYDYLNINNERIKIVGTNKLCSSATYLLFTKCKTYVLPSIYVLFHPMNFEFNDSQQAVNKRAAFYKHLIKTINNVYLTKNFKCNWQVRDYYLYSEDLVSKGIVEGIYKSNK